MTITTLLSLQHSSAIALDSESSEAGHLTDLTGFFEATLQQQIVASDIDANVGAANLAQSLPVSTEAAITASGEPLPDIGTELPVEYAALANLSASFTDDIASGKQETLTNSKSLLFSKTEIERALQAAKLYFNDQTSPQSARLEAAPTNPLTPSNPLTTAPHRSAPVQFSESATPAGLTPEVQAALKLAERNGVLFDSSLRVPATASETNNLSPSVPSEPAVVKRLNEALNNSGPLLVETPAPKPSNPTAGSATLLNTQAPLALADVIRAPDQKSLSTSPVVTNTLVQSTKESQPGSAVQINSPHQQGIRLDASVLANASSRGEPAVERSVQEATVARPHGNEQRLLHPGVSELRAPVRPGETTSIGSSDQLNPQELTANRQVNTAAGTDDLLKNKFTEINNNKILPASHTAAAAKQAVVNINALDQLTPDPMSMINRQALNAESFRNTIKNALERGLGRQTDSTLRTDHSVIADTRSVDGDNGRTIAPPSISSSQPLNTPLSSSAPTTGQSTLDFAGGQTDAAAKLGQRIQWMLSANARRADIQVDPPELGSVQIQVSQEDRQTSVSFVTQTASTRELIEQSLPRLREHLENLGIELADANVEQQSAGHGENDDNKSEAVASKSSDESLAREETEGESSEPGSHARDGGIDAYA